MSRALWGKVSISFFNMSDRMGFSFLTENPNLKSALENRFGLG
jgi:hypothetical protein